MIRIETTPDRIEIYQDLEEVQDYYSEFGNSLIDVNPQALQYNEKEKGQVTFLFDVNNPDFDKLHLAVKTLNSRNI